jgi:arginyl-tRNA synthetase
MTFRALVNEAHQAILLSLRELNYPCQQFAISEPSRKEHGDLTCNVAFHLSKRIKKDPFDIANEIVEKRLKPYIIEKQMRSSSLILSVEAHPAGYINFKANFGKLAVDILDGVLKNPNYGFYDCGRGEQVVIEHTSVNPNKALHIGHIRNIVVGDTIYRIMKATNHKTIVLNYVDDSGLQVADIVVGFRFAGFPLEPNDKSQKFDHYCGDEVYVKMNEIYQTNSFLEEKRRFVLKEIEEGTSDIAKFASELTMRILLDQLKTAWRMKARYDLLNFESQIIHSRLWIRSFGLLKDLGISAFETQGKNNGCWVLKLEDEEDKVLVRTDGTTTYIAKDIPYAAWKLGIVDDPFSYYKLIDQWDGSSLWATTLYSNRAESNNPTFNSAGIAITVVDTRQARLQRIISRILYKILKETKRYHHLSYEAVTLSSQTAKMLGFDIGDRKFMQMSGRKGIYINGDYVLDLIKAKAYDEAKQRNPDLSIQSLTRIAEEIAVSAVRYNLIKYDLDKTIIFDVKESLSLDGDTGPYLQYAYARSQRILKKSQQPISQANYELLTTEEEIDLLRQIGKFDIVLEEAAKMLDPKLLARYGYKLSTVFNLFYEKVPVLKENNKEMMQSRIALVTAYGLTLKNILNILGITPLDEM